MKRNNSMTAHAVLTLAWILAAVYMALLYTPNEINQGNVYRIMYIHVPLAVTAFVAYFFIFIGSIVYVWKRNPGADDLAHAAGEVGFIFCSCVLITGPLWAKPVWGVWWVWDARLTLTFILWLLFVSYLLLRSFFINPARAALLSAVVGIIGFVDVPVDYMANRWWRTQHPQPVILGGPNSGLPPKMEITLFVSMGAFLCLFFYLLQTRIAIFGSGRELSRLRRERAAEELEQPLA
ncbi:MAG: cytochrome c biogenesis protein CcsA [Acidobacteriota bacterium]|nr:cytochrome c biogenesis protein CcsA [Acidobacteriota bacterium]